MHSLKIIKWNQLFSGFVSGLFLRPRSSNDCLKIHNFRINSKCEQATGPNPSRQKNKQVPLCVLFYSAVTVFFLFFFLFGL
jgi:hypothetical protein